MARFGSSATNPTKPVEEMERFQNDKRIMVYALQSPTMKVSIHRMFVVWGLHFTPRIPVNIRISLHFLYGDTCLSAFTFDSYWLGWGGVDPSYRDFTEKNRTSRSIVVRMMSF